MAIVPWARIYIYIVIYIFLYIYCGRYVRIRSKRFSAFAASSLSISFMYLPNVSVYIYIYIYCGRYVRIRSKTQGIALSLGDRITLQQKAKPVEAAA